jgi:hypothetical protein
MADETRRVWEAAQAAKRRVSKWPAWKRGDNSAELRLDELEACVEATHQDLALAGGHTCKRSP